MLCGVRISRQLSSGLKKLLWFWSLSAQPARRGAMRIFRAHCIACEVTLDYDALGEGKAER